MMSFIVRVNDGVGESSERQVVDGKQQIGSDPACQIQINHSEVSQIAAVLDLTGGVTFLENRNTYPVFVGPDELAPGGIAEWRPGSAVQLTRNVSLTLEDSGATLLDQTDEAADSKNPMQAVAQTGLIIVCVILGAAMLMPGSPSTQKEDRNVITFDELIGQYEQAGGPKLEKLKHQQRVLLGYVTEARSLETRWGKSKSDESRAAYEMVLSAERSLPGEQASGLTDMTRQYALSRIDALK